MSFLYGQSDPKIDMEIQDVILDKQYWKLKTSLEDLKFPDLRFLQCGSGKKTHVEVMSRV